MAKYQEIPTPEIVERGSEEGLRTFAIIVGETTIAALTLKTKLIFGKKSRPHAWVTVYETHWEPKKGVPP